VRVRLGVSARSVERARGLRLQQRCGHGVRCLGGEAGGSSLILGLQGAGTRAAGT
jgi:hypothetical protein